MFQSQIFGTSHRVKIKYRNNEHDFSSAVLFTSTQPCCYSPMRFGLTADGPSFMLFGSPFHTWAGMSSKVSYAPWGKAITASKKRGIHFTICSLTVYHHKQYSWYLLLKQAYVFSGEKSIYTTLEEKKICHTCGKDLTLDWIWDS